MKTPLSGLRVVSLCINLPGPVAAARLTKLGAALVKVEPPTGDPLALAAPALYDELRAGQDVRTLDLKEGRDRTALDELLAGCDLLLTSSRPGALARLGLDWETLHSRFPQLCQTAIVGHPPPDENRAGHDLTYAAGLGLVRPPRLPPTLIADLAGAEQAVSASLGLLLARARGQGAGYAQVALSRAAEDFALPLRHGLTGPDGILGGGLPGYNLYPSADGWIALACLEPHFWRALLDHLGVKEGSYQELSEMFAARPSFYWVRWAESRDIPLAAVIEGNGSPSDDL